MAEHLKGRGIPMFAVSGATRQGFDPLLDKTAQMLNELPELTPFEVEEVPVAPVVNEGFTVRREGKVYVVEGPSMDHLINSVNFDDEESMTWFHRTLRRWGVIDALRKAGAGEGDTVSIADMEFDFVE